MNLRGSASAAAALLLSFSGLRPVACADPVSALVSPVQDATGQAGASTPGPFQNPTSGGNPFEYGPLTLEPHFTFEATYGDGIQSSPGHPETTFMEKYEPGLAIQAGKIWDFDYTPTWQFYSNRLFHNTFDQSARAGARSSIEDWTLTFSQSYAKTDQPLIETGRQTLYQTYATEGQVQYAGLGPLVLEATGSQDLQFTSQGGSDSYTWFTQEWAHYRVSPTTLFSVGPEVGWVTEKPGHDMQFEQAWGEILWSPSYRLSVDLKGGIESRSFSGTNSAKLNTPVLDATSSYALGDTTAFTANASQKVGSSLIVGVVEKTTVIGVGVRQRLLQHFNLGVSLSRQSVSYIDVVSSLHPSRLDRVDSLQSSLGTVILRHFTLSASYSVSKNASNFSGYGFSSRQAALSIGYKF